MNMTAIIKLEVAPLNPTHNGMNLQKCLVFTNKANLIDQMSTSH